MQCWGGNVYGQTPLSPIALLPATTKYQVETVYSATYLVTSSGAPVKTWGIQELGTSTVEVQNVVAIMPPACAQRVIAMSVTPRYACFLCFSMQLWCGQPHGKSPTWKQLFP